MNKDNKMNKEINLTNSVYGEIRELLVLGRQKTISVVNTAMVQTYWQIGKIIVNAQGGESRATYGDELLKRISKKLTAEFGKGYDTSNLRYMRLFYLAFPNCDSLRHTLSWTHYKKLISVSNPKAREFYAEEAAKAGWSTRELDRQIATQFYERLLSTQRDEVSMESLVAANLPSKPDKFDPLSLVHDPFIVEFLGVKPDAALRESDLESAIISHLEEFLLELGRGFAFMGRQKRINIDGQHYYPDLVFYNIISRNYIIIDLKMKTVDYNDLAQMQLYVNYYNMEVRREDENPTVGIILCSRKNDPLVKYTLGNRNDIAVFSSQYKLYMPTEEELKQELERTRAKFQLLNDSGKDEEDE